MKQPQSCSNAELYEGIDRSHAVVSAVERGQLRFIREFDSRALWARDGCKHMGEWLAGRLGITAAEGLRRTRAAHALEQLSLTSAALENGTLSLDKVLQLARFATPETEKDLVRYARRASVNAIRRKADLANKPPLEEIGDAHRRRYLQWWTCDDVGSLMLEGMLPAAQGAVVTKALDRVASRLSEMPGDEATDRDQRRADALAMLASAQIAADPDPDRATLVVHADLGALQGDGNGCEIDGGPVIHPEVARRISCDCRLQVVLHDQDGNAVGIGRTSRNVPPWLMRALLHRDGGCTFPGCGTRRFVDGHHIVPWEDGGPTDYDNLMVLCKFHHTLVHEGGWSVRFVEGYEAEWRRPDRRSYVPGPRHKSQRANDPPTHDEADPKTHGGEQRPATPSHGWHELLPTPRKAPASGLAGLG